MADHFATFLSVFGDDISVRWLITILHFLWQGAVVGAVVTIAVRLLRGASARSRYAWCSAALLSLPVCVAVTFCVVEVPVSLQSSTQLDSRADMPAKLSALPSQASATIPALLVETGEATDTPELKQRVVARNAATMKVAADDDSEPLPHSSLAVLARAAPWIAVAYVVGVACFLLRLSAALWGGHRLRVATARVTDATFLKLIADQAERLRLKCVPVVAYCERIAVPTVLGALRPIVLLPIPVMTGLTPDEFAAIIRHEFAHIRRYDLWMNLMQRVIESLLFVHPVVWFISRQLSAEREACCDDLVVSSGYEPMRYAGALLRMAELCAIGGKPGAPALAATGDKTPLLERRIERLMNWGNTPRLQLTRAGMAGLLMTFVSLIVVPGIVHSWAQAQAPCGHSEPNEHVVAENPTLRGVASQSDEGATPSAPTEQAANLQQNADAKLIRGTVVDQQGKPIAGARLWYPYAFTKHPEKTLELDALSDAEGRFTLEIPPTPTEKEVVKDAIAEVWAYAPEYCLGRASPRSTQAKEDPAGIRIELAPATDTSLVVLDPAGQPTAGVLVEPISYHYQPIPDGAKPLVGARTDAEGRVRLPAMARDRLLGVWVTSEAYGVQTQVFTVKASEPAERTIHLRSVCRVEGRVIAENPEWACGIRLVFSTEKTWGPAEQRRPPWPTEGRADVTTDEDGRFAVPIIAGGRLSIETVLDDKLPVRPILPEFLDLPQWPDHLPGSPNHFVDFPFPPGMTTVLKIPMRRLVDIRGSILAEDTGEAIPGVKVHVWYGSSGQGTHVISDAKGQFSARVLPGSVRFKLNLADTKYLQLGWPEPYDVPDNANGFKLPAIEVVPSRPLDGRLIDQDDSPVADAEVHAYYAKWICSSATTGKDGRFTLPKMPVSVDPGEATYHVSLRIGETGFTDSTTAQIIKSDGFVVRVKR